MLTEGVVVLLPQEAQHCEATVAGNRAGLVALAECLLRVAHWPPAEGSIEVYAPDGEGYTLNVRCVAGGWELPTGYTAEWAINQEEVTDG